MMMVQKKKKEKVKNKIFHRVTMLICKTNKCKRLIGNNMYILVINGKKSL